jgi:hypothetical protein
MRACSFLVALGFSATAGAAIAACSWLYSVDGFDNGQSDGGAREVSTAYSGFACGSEGGNCTDPALEVCCMGGGASIARGLCTRSTLCFDDYAQCRTPKDCAHSGVPNSACCYVFVPSTGMGSHEYAKCVDPAACDSGVYFCDPTDPSPCSNGGACTSSPLIGGLYACPPR